MRDESSQTIPESKRTLWEAQSQALVSDLVKMGTGYFPVSSICPAHSNSLVTKTCDGGPKRAVNFNLYPLLVSLRVGAGRRQNKRAQIPANEQQTKGFKTVLFSIPF